MQNPEFRRKYHAACRERRKAKETGGDFSRDHAMTHQEIAIEMGLTRARVWQLERSALRKIRLQFLKLGITNFLDLMPEGNAQFLKMTRTHKEQWIPPCYWAEEPFLKSLSFKEASSKTL